MNILVNTNSDEWTYLALLTQKKCVYVCKRSYQQDSYTYIPHDDEIYFSLNSKWSLFKIYVDKGQKYVYLKIKETYYCGYDPTSYECVIEGDGPGWRDITKIHVYGEAEEINSECELIESSVTTLRRGKIEFCEKVSNTYIKKYKLIY
jgi:hypothetical protein